MKKLVTIMAASALLTGAMSSAVFAGETTKQVLPEAFSGTQVIRSLRAFSLDGAADEFDVKYSITVADEGAGFADVHYYFPEDLPEGEEFFSFESPLPGLSLREMVNDNAELTAEEKATLLALADETEPLLEQLEALYKALPDHSEEENEAILNEVSDLHQAIREIYDREPELMEKVGIFSSVIVTFTQLEEGKITMANGEEIFVEVAPAQTASRQSRED